MGPPTNLELNAKREEHCIQVTPERKYVSGAFDPRSNKSQPAHWSKRSDVYQSKKKEKKGKKRKKKN